MSRERALAEEFPGEASGPSSSCRCPGCRLGGAGVISSADTRPLLFLGEEGRGCCISHLRANRDCAVKGPVGHQWTRDLRRAQIAGRTCHSDSWQALPQRSA